MLFEKKREPGEILTDSLLFLKIEFMSLARLTAIYVLPFMVLMAIVQVYMQIKLSEATEIINQLEPDRFVSELSGLYGNLLLFILFNIFVQSLLAALLYTYLQLYIRKGTGNFTQSDISTLLFPNSLRALAAGFSVTVLSLIGLVFCILPGIVVANSLSLAVFIGVFENKPAGYSIVHSWILVKRQWWVTLSLAIIGILFMWMISIVFTLPVFIIESFPSFFTDPANQETGGQQLRWIISGISVVLSSFAALFPMTMMAMQYFNLIEREKEENGRFS